MKYYYCQVRGVLWSQPIALTQNELDLQHETLELTKDEYETAIETGGVTIQLPWAYTDGYLNWIAAGCPEPDSPTVH